MNEKEKQEKVLKTLQSNARLSASSVAERLGLEEHEVNEIIEKCEKQKIIQAYTCLVKESALGQKVRALIEVTVQPEHDYGFDKISSKICNEL